MTRMNKDEIYEEMKKRGVMNTKEIVDFVYNDDPRYQGTVGTVRRSYAYGHLNRLLEEGKIVKCGKILIGKQWVQTWRAV